MQTQQKNIREDNFYFQKYSISSSQTSVDTIWEIRANCENNVLRYLSRLVNTLIEKFLKAALL